MKLKKKLQKMQEREEAFQMYHNKGLTNAEIAKIFGISPRTVIRWKQSNKEKTSPVCQKPKHKRKRKKKHLDSTFKRILELKKEMQTRSASGIHRLLLRELHAKTPSDSTIRKYLRDEGFSTKKSVRRKGYIKFERGKPNDLW
ncbi:helix-turn-helix domain-containing protein [Candidatus Lokiarchaeum ossiferum]|uniref:helix-turn-helix domain-containing protein n=1 Tax=Candidatus Lokiarchaeum ossiferum TaxID=2951803 RepID=UPI00352F8060